MKKTIVNISTGESQIVDLTPEEIENLPLNDIPPITYPTSTVISDRATGEPYEVFVENGVWSTEPLGESNV